MKMDAEKLLGRCQAAVAAAQRAGADHAEVYATSSQEMEVSFQKNDLDQASVLDETTIGVRVICDGRLGFATSNRPDALDALTAEAVAVARASPPDPMNGLPDARALPSAAPATDPALLALSIETLAALGMDLLRRTRALDPRITIDSGSVSASQTARAVASSTGVAARHESAAAGGGLFGMAVDGDEVGSFSYDGDQVRLWDDLEPALDAAFRRFVRSSVGALGAGQGESFRGSILVPADALGDVILGDLCAMLCADAVRQGRSPFAGRIGERVAAPGFTLRTAGAGLAAYPLAPFDREGQPRTPLTLIEDGILKSFMFDATEARAAGRTSTGHASGGASSLPRIGPTTLTVDAGVGDLAQMHAMDRGVIVTRLSGSTNPVSGDFSGVVKGGFLVRDGEARPIQETTISGNLWAALHTITAISSARSRFYGSRLLPAVRIDDISITAG